MAQKTKRRPSQRVVMGVTLEPDLAEIVRDIARVNDITVSAALYQLVYFGVLPEMVSRMASDTSVPIEQKIAASADAREKYTRYLAGVLPNLDVVKRQIHNLTALNTELRKELEQINANRAAGVKK